MQNKKRLIIPVLFLCSFFLSSKAQQCSSGNPPVTVTFPCGISCSNLNFIIPDLKETSDYVVLNIPFLPFIFDDRASPPVTFASPPQWPGNSYTTAYHLPFSFCFFDSVYDYLVVGSNGCISFDTSNALKWCDPRLINTLNQRPVPLPSGLYYARALIAGVMQDLDPFDTTRAVTGEKVEYRIEGTAPCRKIVISYSKIPLWPGPLNNCQSSINTYQIVLHEGTNFIDVYEKDKPSCAGSNFGNAIIGIQNWARDYAVTPLGRNDAVWGGTNINEAFRFVPSGGNSRFIQAQLSDGFHIIATTTTATPGAQPGQLNVQFNSVCPVPGNSFLILQSIYSSCTGTGNVQLYDTIFINHSRQLDNVNFDVVSASCGGNNGSITVHVPPTSGTKPYQYSINGGLLQTDSAFHNLIAGNYTIHVQDAGGCTKDTIIRVRALNVLSVSFAIDTPSCSLANDGRITLTVLNGNPAFQYSFNGGPFQSSNVFSGLAPGIYSFDVIDATGCTANLLLQVPQGAPLAVTVQTTNTACSGVSNGTITITPVNGRPPYQYSINGGPFQSSNIFTNLSSGNYTIHVIDASGCDVNNVPAQVQTGQPLTASANKTDVSCNGGNNGSITITVNNGVSPYQYSLDNISFQSTNIFSGLTAGNYTVYVKDNNSCSGTVNAVINEPAVITITLSPQAVRCNSETNGSISVAVAGGTGPYQYSLNGITYQANNSFNGLAAGNYTVYIKDNKGCTGQQNVSITQPSVLQASATTQNASCGGGADGQIIVTATGGNGNNQYSSDGTNFQPSNILNVAPGNYTVTVKDSKGCSAVLNNVSVGLNNNLRIAAISDTSICESKSVNLNAISNATQYNWSPATGLSNTTIANPMATPDSTTIYIVNALLGPCIGSDTVTVIVFPAPVADAGSDAGICLGDSVQLSGTGGVKYQWNPATGLTDPAIANPFARPSQNISYSLTVTDINGCSSLSADVISVTVIPPFNVHITPDVYVSPGDVIQLHAEGGTNYLWTPPAGLSNPNISDPLATIIQNITYKVVVTTAEGCRSSDSVTIKAFKGPDIYIPTAFTPNHDGKNDKFIPIPVGIKEIKYFKVYNRWGQIVFSTSKLHEGWDGRLKGIDLDSGVFVWIIQAVTDDNRIIFKKGTVTLIR